MTFICARPYTVDLPLCLPGTFGCARIRCWGLGHQFWRELSGVDALTKQDSSVVLTQDVITSCWPWPICRIMSKPQPLGPDPDGTAKGLQPNVFFVTSFC